MNGTFAQPPGSWQEHKTPDGRAYYYNALTKVTQWTKPEDMMTPAERALSNQPWKEYSAEGGRKYWYNTETKQSSWEMPDAYKHALGQDGGPPSAVAPGGGYPGPSYDQPRDRDRDRDYRERDRDRDRDYRDRDRDRDRDFIPESRQLTYGNDPRVQSFVPASNEPDYATAEEAEAAFTKLLRRSGVQYDWTWDQAMRATIKDPQYRAIKDPKDRKIAFEQYCQDVIVQDKERAKERLTKLRADFATMLKSHPEIKHYTRWKTARPIIERETIFRSTKNDDERRQLFEDYITELKKSHIDVQSTLRKSAMDGLIELLPQLKLEPYTRWSEAQGLLKSTAPFQNDEKYKTLNDFDILTAFQNHVKLLERNFNEARQNQKNKRRRIERKHRDDFVALLQELRKNGQIKAGTKWSQIHPLIENDERYRQACGQSGSTPIDLFWDVVEEEERALRGTRNDVLDVMDDNRFEFTPKTTFDDFLAVAKNDRRTANINRDILTLIFERLQEKKAKRVSDDDKQSERQQRRAFDELRSYIKHLEPPILPEDTWEKVRPRLVRAPEYQAVTSEDSRRGAFEKVLRRIREREEEEKEKDRRRRDRSADRGTYRDKDRGDRSHRSDRVRPARPSRSPEPDAYEADRRKAIAEREKNHRKSSMAESLLADRRTSDSHREREPRDRERERDRDRDRTREHERERDRDRDRDFRSRRDDDYARERRDREEERERLYRRRVERAPVDELPYGDDRPSSARRRRDDDDDRHDSRDSKRLKREKTPRERTPVPPKTKTKTPEPEDVGVHSGSEEGEIEED